MTTETFGNVIKSYYLKDAGLDGFIGKFYLIFKEKIIPKLLKWYQNHTRITSKVKYLPQSIYKHNKILILTSAKYTA